MAIELSRSEYPGIVGSVPPSPAIKIVRDRLQKGAALNNEIAEWLVERRRVEETYANGLKKLINKRIPSESSDMGIFAAPWSRIIESTQSLIAAHEDLAVKLDTDIERPIRDFAQRNVEWAGMKQMESNLSAVAKSIESAESQAEKLRKRGQKAKAQQVAEAANAMSSATAEWDSQAPFVFEKLQAADEARCNNLREALMRMQTLEIDTAQASMAAAEAAVGVILEATPADEIKAFANKATLGRHKLERRGSSTPAPHANGPHGHPPATATSSIATDDSISVQSSGSGGAAGLGLHTAPGSPVSPADRVTAHGGGGGTLGLRRLGTVLRNRNNRNSIFHRSSSPDRRTRGPPPMPPSPQAPRGVESPRPQSGGQLGLPSSPGSGRLQESPHITSNGETNHDAPPSTAESQSALPPTLTVTSSEPPETDAEGYSIPPPDLHRESAAISDNAESASLAEDGHGAPQFKVEIKNEVIHEEDEDADAALSRVANTLRAVGPQNTGARKTRGRRDARDVRNTMFIPNPPESSNTSPPLTPVSAAVGTGAVPSTTPPANIAGMGIGAGPIAPFMQPQRSGTARSDTPSESDTHSIKSGRSITSLPTAAIRHPELTDPGLSASLVEAVSVSFTDGAPTRTFVTGEVALAFNTPASSSPPTTPVTLRLDNFATLEKVAPNPAFISALPDRVGEYTVTPASLVGRGAAVAFKYQVHLPAPDAPDFVPILVSPVWRIEPHQASVIIHWRPNPAFRRTGTVTGPVTLRNVTFVTGVEGVPAASCQSKPVGTFSREKGRLGWKLGDLLLSEGEEGGKLLARFAVDGAARGSTVDVRWEVIGEGAASVGSGLGVVKKEEAAEGEEEEDPFKDVEEEKSHEGEKWVDVPTVRRLMAGKFVAS